MSISEGLAGTVLSMGSSGPVVENIQKALRCAGHELVVDGIFGHCTKLAVMKFQAARSMTVDGRVGPNTARALDVAATAHPVAVHKPEPSVIVDAPHLAVMRALTGTMEIPGAKSNPLIMSWRDEIISLYPDIAQNIRWFVDDDTPWCGLAAAYAVACCAFKPPVAPLAAANWARWGVALPEPIPGAVMVFKRPGGHHVAFYEGEDMRSYHVRGGNQANTVNVTRVAKDRLIAIRWPADYPVPVDSGRVQLAENGTVSTNEA